MTSTCPAGSSDSFFELVLGLLFGIGAGICTIGLLTVPIVLFAPQWIPRPLLLMLGVPNG